MMNANASAMNTDESIAALLRRAKCLGYGKGDIVQAMECYQQAKVLARDAVRENMNDASRCLLVRVLIDTADFQVVILSMHTSACDILVEALSVLSAFDEKTLDQQLLLGGVYRAMFQSEHNSLKYNITDKPPEWVPKGLKLMRRLQAKYQPLNLDIESHRKLLFLLATFLSFDASWCSNRDAVRYYSEALGYMGRLHRFSHGENEFWRRFTIIVRNRAYSYHAHIKDYHRAWEGTIWALRLCLERSHSRSRFQAVDHIDLYYAYWGLADYFIEAENDKQNDEAIRDALGNAEACIAGFLKMVPCSHSRWQQHSWTLVVTARYLDGDEKFSTLVRAVDSAKKAMAHSDAFYVAYFDHLTETLKTMSTLAFQWKRRDLQALVEERLLDARTNIEAWQARKPEHYFIGRSVSKVRLLLAEFYGQKLGCHRLEELHLSGFLCNEENLHGTSFTSNNDNGANNGKRKARTSIWRSIAKSPEETEQLETLRKQAARVPKAVEYSMRCKNLKTGVHEWVKIPIYPVIFDRDPLSDLAKTLREDFNLEIPFSFRIIVRKLQVNGTKEKGDFVHLLQAKLSKLGSAIEYKVKDPVTSAECCICMDPIGCKDNHHLRCGHCFHSNCLLDWCLHENKCPLCRRQLV